MLFVIGFQPHHDLYGVRHRRLIHVDLLETPLQGAVFL